MTDLAFLLNNEAVLVLRDQDGAELLRIEADPIESRRVNGEPMRADVFDTVRRFEGYSFLVFPLTDPALRLALESGATVHVLWRAGMWSTGDWQWPVGFGDCAGDRLPSCVLTP